MKNAKRVERGVILVGHGGVPRDYPRERLGRLRALEVARRGTQARPSEEELRLESELRSWPRSAETDPYQAGLEAVAERLGSRLDGRRLVIAYNEFCAPSLEDAVAQLVRDGCDDISVVPAMLTPGGSHSEIDIPQCLDALRRAHPQVRLRYAWPVDLDLLAAMIAAQVRKFD